jgi:hypothetical protein
MAKNDKYSEDKLEKGEGLTFHKFHVPQMHNGLEGAKSATDRGDNEWAHRCLDSVEKSVAESREQLKRQQDKRDTDYNMRNS